MKFLRVNSARGSFVIIHEYFKKKHAFVVGELRAGVI